MLGQETEYAFVPFQSPAHKRASYVVGSGHGCFGSGYDCGDLLVCAGLVDYICENLTWGRALWLTLFIPSLLAVIIAAVVGMGDLQSQFFEPAFK